MPEQPTARPLRRLVVGTLAVAALGAGAPVAASADVPVGAAPAGGCGLSRLEQSYTVCGEGKRDVVIYFSDSMLGGTASASTFCWGPGTYRMLRETGGFRLATAAGEGAPCTE